MKARISTFTTLVIVVILAVVIGFNSYYTLENAEQAVIERFGEYVTTVDTPGLNFKLPLIDRVYIINTNELLSIQYGYRPASAPTTTSKPTYQDVEDEQIVLTKGSYLVNIGAIIQYQITEPKDYIYNVDDQEDTIRLAFESVLRRNMQNKDLENALINKDSIASEILPDLSRKLDAYGIGIKIVDVKFTDVLLPDSVQFAYDDVNIAENEKTEYTSKAAKYRNEQIPQARAEAYQLIQSAEAYKAEKIAQAKGDVINFTQVYEKYAVAQDITKTRLYIETMESILKEVESKYILDFEDGGNTVKYLPLNPETLN